MSGGLDKVRLDQMHDVMSSHVDAGVASGIVTLVARGDDVHVDAIGTKSVGGDHRMERDTIFRVASMTKPVTAVAAMTLVEDCVIRLDEPVDDLLPELADRQVLTRPDAEVDDTVAAERPISLRDLLTFTMGQGILMGSPETHPILKKIHEDGGEPGPPRPQAEPEPDEWMRRLGSLPLIYQPGDRWMYHTGADVLGVLIARASGQSLDNFLRERIFEPLGMNDTSFSVPASKIARFATSYSTNPENGALELFDEAGGGQWSNPPAFESGGGGLVSTADDFLAFGRMMLGGGTGNGERILSRPTIELMTTDHLTPEQKSGQGLFLPDFLSWGLGMSVVTKRSELPSVGSYGWDGGLGTSWRNDPKEDLVGVLLTQAAWTSPNPPAVFLDFWTCAYAGIED